MERAGSGAARVTGAMVVTGWLSEVGAGVRGAAEVDDVGARGAAAAGAGPGIVGGDHLAGLRRAALGELRTAARRH